MVDHVHHRNIGQGYFRAAVLGFNDGLLTNLSLILGVVGGNFKANYVAITGLAGLLAGAFSMAIGEYTSMRAQKELLENELKKEQRELVENPNAELEELKDILVARGLSVSLATEVAQELMRDNKIALETHAREELGIDPYNLGAPFGAAFSSFLAFAVGAFVPLLPWLVSANVTASVLSIVFTLVASSFSGFLLARLSNSTKYKALLRQLLLLSVAAGVTFTLGHLVGSVI